MMVERQARYRARVDPRRWDRSISKLRALAVASQSQNARLLPYSSAVVFWPHLRVTLAGAAQQPERLAVEPIVPHDRGMAVVAALASSSARSLGWPAKS
jgi:hypothetical protein